MRVAAGVVAVLLATGLSWCWGQVKEEAAPSNATDAAPPFNFWMNVKLQTSQKIFAALTEADYETILESTNTLKMLSTLEGFVRRRDPRYHTQLRTFEFAVEEIQRQAEKENIEGIVLGFNQLTLSCVNCHKQLRDSETPTP